MAVDDIVGVRVVGRYQSQNIVTTLHYKITAQTVAEHQFLQLLTNAWDTNLSAMWAARHIDTYELVGVKGFSKSGQNKRPGITDIGTSGSVVGSEVPSLICRVITLYTDSSNYRRHGRVMLSGCDTTMFNDDDGAVTSAEITALATLADELIDPITFDEQSVTPVIPPTDVLPVEEITASLVRKTPACIRSRRVRGFSIG